jgi:response regulator RpfG family c-di-GMP phosphodiesterase
VSELVGPLGLEGSRWELEMAAMLSQIGCITLPSEIVEKVYHGMVLTQREHAMVERLPGVAERILAKIPRLEGVREIVRLQDRRFSGIGLPRSEPHGEGLPLGARLLKIVLDFDALEARGLEPEVTFDTLRSRDGWYDTALLETFARVKGNSGRRAEIHEIALAALRPGMVLAEDVHSRSGSLLIARGHEVNEGLLERIRNFSQVQEVREPLRVVVRDAVGVATASAG